MRRIVIFILGVMCLKTEAQEIFIPYGKITFEKKINLVRAMENSNLPQEAREKMQKYVTSNWDLFFDQQKSVYKPSKKENESSNNLFTFSLGKQSNAVYTDYAKEQRVLKRSIMDEDYLLTDTIPKIDWKVMNEVRNIAGYECRKAIGVIYDTVYVVAFYTDELLMPGGPEGFGGLPGTILGLAIPRYNTTWFAVKVNGFENHLSEIVPPISGKKIETEKDLKKLIELFTRYEPDKKEKTESARKRLYGFTL